MGHLLNEMRRLGNEILTARHAREALVKELSRSAKELSYNVSAMLAGFSRAHAEMARTSKAERMAFKAGLKKTVTSIREEIASDLAEGNRAWFGKRDYGTRRQA